ncbi:hypothetical protein FRC08_001128 [Ceratobasidium sp. 394]|nr:hypothetical protein FRC08_001128 [Ceratobasidium sp. 394]
MHGSDAKLPKLNSPRLYKRSRMPAQHLKRLSTTLLDKLSTLSRLIISCLTISNSSATLVPINALPTEILTCVFSFAISASCSTSSARTYPRELPPGARRNPLVSIMQTSSRWRQIILNTRSFWSHVDAYPSRISSKTSLLSEPSLGVLRLSSGIPIHLHFSPQNPWLRTKNLAALLDPYLPNVVSLEFDPKCSLGLFQAILDVYSSSGRSGCIKSLIYPRRYGRVEYRDPGVLKWPPGLLIGIVELTLGNLSESNLALHQIATILASTPRIQTLRLYATSLQPADEKYHPTPANLPDLQLLDINCHAGYSATCFKI